MKIFQWIGKVFTGLGRLFLPMLSTSGASSGAQRRPILQWLLRLLILLVGILRVRPWFVNSLLPDLDLVRSKRLPNVPRDGYGFRFSSCCFTSFAG